MCPYHESCTTASIYNITGNDNKVNLGTFNELVVYPNGGPRFEYAGGDKCPGMLLIHVNTCTVIILSWYRMPSLDSYI